MLGENRRPPATFRLRRTADTAAHRARPSGGGRVPVTARLSKRFYDVFGEEIATELRVELVKELAGVKSGLKWMLAFWAPTALAVIGTGAGVLSLLLRR